MREDVLYAYTKRIENCMRTNMNTPFLHNVQNVYIKIHLPRAALSEPVHQKKKGREKDSDSGDNGNMRRCDVLFTRFQKIFNSVPCQ